MVHDDLRVEWIRQRVCAGFILPDCNCFDELLSRGDGEEEQKIIDFLNIVSQEDSSVCLLFFKTIIEEEVDVEFPVGKLGNDYVHSYLITVREVVMYLLHYKMIHIFLC